MAGQVNPQVSGKESVFASFIILPAKAPGLIKPYRDRQASVLSCLRLCTAWWNINYWASIYLPLVDRKKLRGEQAPELQAFLPGGPHGMMVILFV